VISPEFLKIMMLLCKIFNYPYLDGFTLSNIIVFGEGYKLWKSSLCSFLRSPVTYSHLGTDILRDSIDSPAASALFFPKCGGPGFHAATDQQAKIRYTYVKSNQLTVAVGRKCI